MSTDVITGIPEEPSPRRSLGAVLRGAVSRALFGDPARHAAETLSRFAALDGGQKLLDLARKHDVEIIIGKRRGHEDGYVSYDIETGKTYVFVADNGNPSSMVMTLWHELRHVCQAAEEKRLHQPVQAFGRDLALRHFHMKMHEADAFTSEIMMALREKKAGRPEYYEAFLKKSRVYSSVHSEARKYFRTHPPESFKDDAALARGLFTHIMLNGLTPYGPARIIHHARLLEAAEDATQLEAIVEKAPPLPPMPRGMPYSKSAASLYGHDFMSGVSMRALSAAFRKGEVPQERRILLDMDSFIGKAATMDDRTFTERRDAIVAAAREYYADEDPMPRFFDKRAHALEQALAKSALADKPPLMGVFAKAVVKKAAAAREVFSFPHIPRT